MRIRNQKPLLGTPLRKGHPLARGLVGYWPLLEGTGKLTEDLSGNGHDGTFIDGPIWIPGQHGPAVEFSDNAIDCGDYIYTGCSTALTIVCKARYDGSGSSLARLIDKYPGPSIYHFLAGTNMGFYGTIGGGIVDKRWNTSPCAIGDYITWAFVLGEGYQHCYRNGILSDNQLSDGAHNGVYSDGGAVNGYIGNRASDMGRNWDGPIDYVYIYNRALSASEIQQLYYDPFCMFERMPIHKWAGAYGGGVSPSQTLLDYERSLRGANRGVIRGAA